ncbi:MAG TPA: GntR family transcriptional regulator [Burkholderiales bacterium]
MSTPRYVRVADALIREIRTGRYPVGEMLPPELELCEHYGVSRHTAREAIRKLVDLGLISRRPGIGTHVRATQAQGRFVASLSSVSELFQYTQRTRLKVVGSRTVTANAELAAMLHCKPEQRWLRIDACRYPLGQSAPITYMEIYVLPGHAGIRSRLEGGGTWVYGLLEELYGARIVEVQQDIGSLATPERVAKLLGVPAGTAALHVLRYYYASNERLLSVSMNVYPQNRFRISTRWRLEPRP